MNESNNLLLKLLAELKDLHCLSEDPSASDRLKCLTSILRNNLKSVISVSDDPLKQIEKIFPWTANDDLKSIKQTDRAIILTPASSVSTATALQEAGQIKMVDGLMDSENVVCYLIKYIPRFIKDEVCFCSFLGFPRYQALDPGMRYDYGLIECPANQYHRVEVIQALRALKDAAGFVNLFLTGNRQSLPSQWTGAYGRIKEHFFATRSGEQVFVNHDGETGREITDLLDINNKRVNSKEQSKRYKNVICDTVERLIIGLSEKEAIYKSELISASADNIKLLEDKKWELSEKRNHGRKKFRQRRDDFVLKINKVIRDFAHVDLPAKLMDEMHQYQDRKKFLKVVNDIIQKEEESFREKLNGTIQETMDKVVQEQIELFKEDLKEMGQLVEKVVPGYNFEGNIAGLAGGISVAATGSYVIVGMVYSSTWNLFQAALGAAGLHQGATAAAGAYAAIGGAAAVGAVFVVAGLAAFWLSRKIVTKLTWKKNLLGHIQGEINKYLLDYIRAWDYVINNSYDQVIEKNYYLAGKVIDHIVEGIKNAGVEYRANRFRFESIRNNIINEKKVLLKIEQKLESVS